MVCSSIRDCNRPTEEEPVGLIRIAAPPGPPHLNARAPGFGIHAYLLLGTPERDALFASAQRIQGRQPPGPASRETGRYGPAEAKDRPAMRLMFHS
jgi:hypothetical protein